MSDDHFDELEDHVLLPHTGNTFVTAPCRFCRRVFLLQAWTVTALAFSLAVFAENVAHGFPWAAISMLGCAFANVVLLEQQDNALRLHRQYCRQ